MDRNFDFFDPLHPLRTILLNKAYAVIWTFGKPPPPAMSTWFMNAPLPLLPLAKSRQCMIIFHENNVELSYLSFKTRALKCYVWNLFHESRKNKAVYISSTVRMQFSRHCMIYLMLYVHNAKSIPDSLKLERIDEICKNKCFSVEIISENCR